MRRSSVLSWRCRMAAVAAILAGLLAGCSGSPSAPSSASVASAGGTVGLEGGLPFGPMQPPIDQFGQPPFTAAYINAGPADRLESALSTARARHVRLIVRLSESRDEFQAADGTFSLKLWKQSIDRLRGVDFAPYVADGTLLGAELVNEPHVKSNWGGVVVPPAQLDAAAAYAKSIWPTLPVGAGRSDYATDAGPWRYLDFSHSRYHMRKGPVDSWLQTTVAEARAAGLGLVLGLNFYAGEIGDTPMTADEIRQFGAVLARERYACAMTGYIYDDGYFARPGVMDAFRAVAAIAATHPASRCYFGSPKAPPQ